MHACGRARYPKNVRGPSTLSPFSRIEESKAFAHVVVGEGGFVSWEGGEGEFWVLGLF